MAITLTALGWTPFFQDSLGDLADGLVVSRVAVEHRGAYLVLSEQGEFLAEVSGKLRYQAKTREDFPAVGDWVVCDARHQGTAMIHQVVSRKSKFSRKMAGATTEEQIVAANVDTIFVVTSLNFDFNVRRLERYLVMAWDSGANPVVVLSKADLGESVQDKVAEVESVAPGVPICVVSVVTHAGLDALRSHIRPGSTAALLGSSGVGKSSLINYLVGAKRQEVKELRRGDDKGRHTTTHRELVLLPDGGLLIDTPGMRELQLWTGEDGFDHTFADIQTLSAQCRFGDCSHTQEPGCAVTAAVEDGRLTSERMDSFRKLQRELEYLARKTDVHERLKHQRLWKKLSKSGVAQKRLF